MALPGTRQYCDSLEMFLWLGVFAVLTVLAFVLLRNKPPEGPAPKKVVGNGAANGGAIPSLIVEDDLEITLITASPHIERASKPSMRRARAESGATVGGAAAQISAAGAGASAAAGGQAPMMIPNLATSEPGWDDEPEGTSGNGPTVEVIYEKDAEVEEVTAPLARILITAQGDSDRGRRRPDNQDSMLIVPERSLFVVADGMGGYEGGQLASSLAVETIRQAFERDHFEGHTEATTEIPRRGRELACAIQMANQAVMLRAKTSPALSRMGTTILAARFSPNKQRVYIGHVGDSRCYRIRSGELRQITTDHTMRQFGMKGPRANDLTRAVGVGANVTIDLIVDKPQNEDVYILCSDGLSKMVKDERIAEIVLSEKDLETAVYGLIEAANDAGGRDNVTAVLIKVVDRLPTHPKAAQAS